MAGKWYHFVGDKHKLNEIYWSILKGSKYKTESLLEARYWNCTGKRPMNVYDYDTACCRA